MLTQTPRESRVRRMVNDLAVAEVLMIQATVESAEILSAGLADISEQLAADGPRRADQPSLPALLQHTAAKAVEPYTTRLAYFRQLTDL